MTQDARVGAWLLVVALLAGACTPLGLARGDYWEGISTGDLGPCPSFDINLAIDDNRISGTATSEYPWGVTLWEVRGLIGSEWKVTVETRTQDPRVSKASLEWTGSFNPILWDLTLAGDATCPTPRVARLQRR